MLNIVFLGKPHIAQKLWINLCNTVTYQYQIAELHASSDHISPFTFKHYF